jgi:uncharacterized protein YndB with AHSA1/START domain
MPELIHSVEIAASPKAIFPLVATPQGLACWWAEDVTEVPGGAELGFFDRATTYRLRGLTLAPPATAAWLCESGKEWALTRLVFHMAAKGERTELRFTHEGWRDVTPYFIACNSTWGALLYRLKTVAEGGAPRPLFTRSGMSHG